MGKVHSKSRSKSKSRSTGTEKGYCVKCKRKNCTMTDPTMTKVRGRSGTRNAVTGHCSKCDTKMFKFTSS